MAASAIAPVQKLHLIKDERHLFSSSDDMAIMKQILPTHAPDGRELDVRPLLHVVEDVLHRATPTIVVIPETHLELLEDKEHHMGLIGMMEAIAYPIHRISCEITSRCSGSGDAHATAVHMFHLLSNYTWDAKVVLALAGFAVSYGEFWLTAQYHTVNPLAKSIVILKQLPDILEHTDMLKNRFEAVNNLIKCMLDVTNCIIEFKELPTEYISPDSPDMTMALNHIPTAVYWVIRGIIACVSQIEGLIGHNHEYISSTTEAWELSSLTHKLSTIHGHLTKQLSLCHEFIEKVSANPRSNRNTDYSDVEIMPGERKHVEAYKTLERLFNSTHIDNMKILKALIYSKDELPLLDGLTKRRVNVDVLRRKIVMLFISDLDITHEELFVLIQIYNDTHQGKIERHYEIVWLPIIDRYTPWTSEKEETFNRLVSSMPWYSVHRPTLLEPPVVKYIRNVWGFDRKPMLVVLDPQGKVVCPNALHMIWIWGSLAFPFTSNREEALWKEETWRMEFLVDEIDPSILEWVREGRHVCLYGGEDIEWIRRFTKEMRKVSLEARVPLEMVYVGKSNPKERIKKVIEKIAMEKLSGYWQDPVMVWFFWVRLESMWYSKMQHGRTIEDDPIMQEVMQMLSFDGSGEGWAVISRGSLEMVKSHGKKIVDCLMQFDTWKGNIEHEGFIPALTTALLPYHTHEHCTRLILPGETGGLRERVICAECKRPMEKLVLYRCCNE